MTGSSGPDYVVCPKCGHDRNAPSALKCEICGFQLKKPKLPVAVYAGLAAAITAAGAGLVYTGLSGISQSSKDTTVATSSPVPNNASTSTQSVANFMSKGDRVLLADNPNPDKQAATVAIAANDFQTAITKLEAARKANPGDPETLIYLNNARIGNKDAMHIAAVVPIGSNPNDASELLRGVAQAQDEALKAGTPIAIAIADDGNNPDRAKDIANALVKENSISAVVGHGTSRTSLAAAPIYAQNQLLQIAPTSTSTELTNIPKSTDGANYIFRTIPSDRFTGTALARYMLTGLKKRTAAVFYNSNSSYSKSLQAAFSETLNLEGGQVTQTIDLSKGDATRQVAGLKTEVLVLLPDSETLPQAMQVAQANHRKLPLIAGDAVYKIDTLKKAGTDLNGAVLSVPWHPLASPNPTFPKAALNLWAGGNVNWRTALSYDAVQVLLAAQSQAKIAPGSGSQGRIALAKALANSGFTANGATGEIRFLPSGDRNARVLLLQVKPGKSSGTGFDFVPLQ